MLTLKELWHQTEKQDAYILGVNEPIDKFTGKIIAIVHKKDDIEEMWVVVLDGMLVSKDEIRQHMINIILNCKFVAE